MTSPETRSKHVGCPPPLALERALYGQLSGTASAIWSAHLATCARCKERLQEMRQEGERYLESDRARALRRLLLERDRDRTKPDRTYFFSWRVWAMAVPSVLLLVAVALFGILDRGPGDDLQAKGRGVLSLVVQDRNGVTRAWDGSALRQDEVIQPSWASTRDGHLALLARDGAGEVTVLFPADGERSRWVGKGPAVPLGPSLRLATARGENLFWVLFSPQPFSTREVLSFFSTSQRPPASLFSGEIIELKLKVNAAP